MIRCVRSPVPFRRRARFSVPYQGDLFVHYLLGHRYSRGDVRQPVGDFMDAGPQSVSGIALSFVSVLRSYDTENVFIAFPRFIYSSVRLLMRMIFNSLNK